MVEINLVSWNVSQIHSTINFFLENCTEKLHIYRVYIFLVGGTDMANVSLWLKLVFWNVADTLEYPYN